MRGLLLFVLLFASSVLFYGQKEFQDFETWYRFKLSKKIGDIRVHVKPGVRLYENSTQLKSMLSDFGASYKVHKYFGTTFNYRYSLKNKFDLGNSPSHRLNLDLNSDVDVGELNVKLRNRTQMDSDYRGLDWANRTKLALTYDVGEGIAFFTSTEAWVVLESLSYLSKYRISFGLEIDLAKRNAVEIFYRRQALLNEKVPTKSNIIGIAYKLKLKSS